MKRIPRPTGLANDIRSAIESAKIGAVPSGTKLPQEMRGKAPPIRGAEDFQRWWAAQLVHAEIEVKPGIWVRTIRFEKPTMVDGAYALYWTYVFGGKHHGLSRTAQSAPDADYEHREASREVREQELGEDDLRAVLARLRAEARHLMKRDGDEEPLDIDSAEGAALERAVRTIERVIGRGNTVLILTPAELDELRFAAGNSTSDPDWLKSRARTKRALRSVARKVGFHVAE